MPRRQRVTWLGRFLRGYRLDRNALRRASDRLETIMLAALVVAFVAGAPFAAQASGAWVHAISRHAQLEQEASIRQVPAVLLEAATTSSSVDAYGPSQADARARWTAPDGKVVTGDVPTELGVPAGAHVTVWSTFDGQVATAPLRDTQVSGQTVLGEVAAVWALGVLLTVVGFCGRRVLDKRRMAAWDEEWRATGPRWTTRA